MPNNPVDDRFAHIREAMREVKAVFGATEHPAITMYEDAPCYPLNELVELSRLGNEIQFCRDAARRKELIAAFAVKRDSIKKKARCARAYIPLARRQNPNANQLYR